MAITLPDIGSSGWGPVLNGALTGLDNRTTALEGAVRCGTGSPEGVVTAGVGATYTDSAATNGAVEWIKATGTGNTGWRVAYGNTGWRTVHTATGAGDFQSGSLLLGRQGDRVTLRIASMIAKAGTGPCVVNDIFPTGFGSGAIAIAGLVGANGSPAYLGQWQVYLGGGTKFASYNGKAGNLSDTFVRDTAMVSRGELSWITDDPWPVGALPGTAG